jgi:hypothetical protein
MAVYSIVGLVTLTKLGWFGGVTGMEKQVHEKFLWGCQKDLGVCGRMILKSMLEKYVGRGD